MPPIWLLTIIARTGLPSRFQRAAAWIAAALAFALLAGLLIAAFWHWVGNREETAVKLDRADITAEAATRVLAADRAATANQMEADKPFQASQEELRNVVVSKATVDPVGPGVRSVLDRMREQQQAGNRGAARK